MRDRSTSPLRGARSRSPSQTRQSTDIPDSYNGRGYEHPQSHGYGHNQGHGYGDGRDHYGNNTADSSYHGGTTHAAKHEPENPPQNDMAHNPAYSPKPRRSPLAIVLGVIVGLAVAAGTSYVVHMHVQNMLANATINGDMDGWKKRARSEIYDGCYNGCTTCEDPEFSLKACQVTARAAVQGLVCNAERMWNWKAADRYPEQCLAAVAEIMMGTDLTKRKQMYRNRYALIIVTVLGGAFVGWLVFKGISMLTGSKEGKRSAGGYAEVRDFKSSPSRGGNGGKTSTKKLAVALAGVFGAKKGHAYACAGRDAAVSQYFTSPSGNIQGVVQSWFSECHDKQHCQDVCQNSCTTSSTGQRTCSKKCNSNKCQKTIVTDRTPKNYVDVVIPKVKACGFNIANTALSSGSIATRVANPNIEKKFRVRIAVNGLNVTKADETDKSIMCLYDIGK